MLLQNSHVDTKVTLAFLSLHSVNTSEAGTVRVTVPYVLIRVTGDVKYMVAYFSLFAGVVCCGSKHIHKREERQYAPSLQRFIFCSSVISGFLIDLVLAISCQERAAQTDFGVNLEEQGNSKVQRNKISIISPTLLN
jgi:hypothetical protein